jgi:hypothetical protein
MTTRTVRFDDATEKALDEVRAATGWPISEVLKRGVNSSSNTRTGVRMALKRKHGR